MQARYMRHGRKQSYFSNIDDYGHSIYHNCDGKTYTDPWPSDQPGKYGRSPFSKN